MPWGIGRMGGWGLQAGPRTLPTPMTPATSYRALVGGQGREAHPALALAAEPLESFSMWAWGLKVMGGMV